MAEKKNTTTLQPGNSWDDGTLDKYPGIPIYPPEV